VVATKPAQLGPARVLCIALAKLIVGICEGKRSLDEIAKELAKLSEYAAGLAPKKVAPAVDTTTEENEVFRFWREAAGKHESKFTVGRRVKVRARLREKYTVSQIRQAIEFVCNDAWHMGENPNHKTYNDLELICRNATKLEEYLDRAREAGVAAPKSAVEESKGEAIEQAKLDSALALKAGDTDAYNQAQSRLRNLTKR
jgi:hypothetical protein